MHSVYIHDFLFHSIHRKLYGIYRLLINQF